ncbi:hypothetical protein ASG35_09390 [Burkholderia sp. Leaf177]|uniref:COG4705 family protein n=1 Tax=Burkholderia sp. Leaf177 TaxID=1736287 RepID=UPI0006FE9AF0|nr:hypothetical protein [Burkholderia sp. Leaf177]KQR78985.1 hypothetical protein ASG35_09390 [Burkholderia sp. Leaf177]
MTTRADLIANRSDRFNKVPEAALIFWVIKLLSTTVGETGADYLAVSVGLGALVTSLLCAALLIAVLVMQLRAPTYVPWIYWMTVVLVSIVGTQITDALTDGLSISLYISTSVFAVCLAAVFFAWFRAEGTLSIRSINTRPRELFYWAAMLVTFALGTAAGDLATEALGLGFALGIVVFGGLIALTAFAYYVGAGAVLTFWTAYILTRPLGASLGDFLSQSKTYGGLGWGNVGTSAVFLSVIIALVIFVSVRHASHVRSSRAAAEL